MRWVFLQTPKSWLTQSPGPPTLPESRSADLEGIRYGCVSRRSSRERGTCRRCRGGVIRLMARILRQPCPAPGAAGTDSGQPSPVPWHQAGRHGTPKARRLWRCLAQQAQPESPHLPVQHRRSDGITRGGRHTRNDRRLPQADPGRRSLRSAAAASALPDAPLNT